MTGDFFPQNGTQMTLCNKILLDYCHVSILAGHVLTDPISMTERFGLVACYKLVTLQGLQFNHMIHTSIEFLVACCLHLCISTILQNAKGSSYADYCDALFLMLREKVMNEPQS